MTEISDPPTTSLPPEGASLSEGDAKTLEETYPHLLEKVFSQLPELAAFTNQVQTDSAPIDNLGSFDLLEAFTADLFSKKDGTSLLSPSDERVQDDLLGEGTVQLLPAGARLVSFHHGDFVRLEYQGKMLYLKWSQRGGVSNPADPDHLSVLDRTPRGIS